MKRFVITLFAVAALVGAGIASAQSHGGGGGSHGGGGWSGGSHGGGGWSGGSHGAGGWSGGSHGGGSWSGGSHGSWSGGSHGGWSGGSHGGWHGGSWHGGTRVIVGFGGPWWGWWPGYYPYYYGYGYPVTYPYVYPSYDDYYAPMYDTGAYVQRPDAAYQGQQQYQGGQVTSDGYLYYCPNPAGYYPQIGTCAAGWLRVVPQGAQAPSAPAQR